jgi:hypothetical protein
MADEKKKPGLAALVIGAAKPKADEDGDDGDYSEAAGEAFDALKSGDREAFAEALKACVMSCKH